MPDLPQLALDLASDTDFPTTQQCETPANTDVPRETVGKILRDGRQRSGKTLMDISIDLKIPPHHLIAIENDNFAALPGRPYAVGFVRSYANYLRLDSEFCVRCVKAEIAGPHEDPSSAASVPASQDQPAPASASDGTEPDTVVASPLARAISLLSPTERGVPFLSAPDSTVRQWAVAGVMIVIMAYFGYSVMASALRAGPPPVPPVPARLTAETGLMPKKKPRPAVVALAQPAKIALGSREPAPTQPETVPPPPIARVELPPPISQPVFDPPAESTAPETDVVSAKPESELQEQLPPGEHWGEQNRDSHVTLRVHRSTRVAVLGIRNHEYIDRTLRAGDTYRVPNLKGLKLTAPDAGAIEVIVDGRPLGFAGKDGAGVRGLLLQPQSIVARYHPPR